MSLPLLGLMVIAGIAAIVIAIHLTGGSRRALLAGQGAAVTRFAADFPEETPVAIWLTVSGDAAFLDLAGGRLGLVQSFGDRFLTRIVTPADAIALRRIGDSSLSLRLSDFTLSGGLYNFADAHDADAVAVRLRGDARAYDAVEAA